MYLLHSSFSIGCKVLLISSTDVAFQSGLFSNDETSSFAASPLHLLLKIMRQVMVISGNSFKTCKLATSPKDLVNTDSWSRRYFLKISKELVTGSSSILLNFLLCSIGKEW